MKSTIKERNLKKFVLMLCMFLVTGCTSIRPVASTQETSTPINVCHSAATVGSTVPIYAFEKGIYAKYGLAVNLVYIEGGSEAAAALIAGNMDFCQIAGSAVVNGVVAGADLALIAGLINTYTYSLMVRPEIATAADLQGKALGISDFGSSSDAVLRVALQSLNLRADEDVAILAVGGQNERILAMETGAIVGTMVTIPQTVRARALGYRELVNMAALNAPYQHTAFASTRAFLDSHRDVAIRFLQATSEAITQMKTDKAGVFEVLEHHLLLDPEKDAAELEEAYNGLILPYMPEKPYPSIEGVQVLLDSAAVENPAAATYTPADVIDSSLLEEIEASGFWKQSQP